jgi:hypothetical protein
MRSKILAVVALTLASLVAVPAVAFAAPDNAAKAARHEKSEKQFPMPAAEFKSKVDNKLSRARTHMEERASKLDADKAKELRAKFDAGAANVNAEVAKATADGTVTKEEAKNVFTAMKAMHGGKHAHKGHKKDQKKS